VPARWGATRGAPTQQQDSSELTTREDVLKKDAPDEEMEPGEFLGDGRGGVL